MVQQLVGRPPLGGIGHQTLGQEILTLRADVVGDVGNAALAHFEDDGELVVKLVPRTLSIETEAGHTFKSCETKFLQKDVR